MSTKRPVKLKAVYWGLLLFVVAQVLILLVTPRIDPFLDEKGIDIPTQPSEPISWWPGEVIGPSGEVIEVPAHSFQGGFVSDDARSILTLSLTYHDQEQLEKILNTAAVVLIKENSLGLPQLGGETAELVQLDEPIVNRVSSSILNQLDLPFRIGLALAVGVLLAIFVDYIVKEMVSGVIYAKNTSQKKMVNTMITKTF